MLAVLRCLVAFTWAHVALAAPCEPSKEDGERLQRVLGQADLRITEQKAQGIYTQLDPVARTVLDLLCFGMWEVVFQHRVVTWQVSWKAFITLIGN